MVHLHRLQHTAGPRGRSGSRALGIMSGRQCIQVLFAMPGRSCIQPGGLPPGDLKRRRRPTRKGNSACRARHRRQFMPLGKACRRRRARAIWLCVPLPGGSSPGKLKCRSGQREELPPGPGGEERRAVADERGGLGGGAAPEPRTAAARHNLDS